MGTTVAIICEYNPFHNGHQYQIERVKELIPNSTIACIMSGNTTQRGEFALFEKYSRAKAAVLCGANAVFEIPYPFSSSSAEIFALIGVQIANDIGANYLCFGSESDDLSSLIEIANLIDSKEFELEFQKNLVNKKNSYLLAKEITLKSMGKQLPKDSNDILAIEYLRAIKHLNSNMQPLIIKRNGNGYKDNAISNLMSASAIRECFYLKKDILSVPEKAKKVFEEDVLDGQFLNIDMAEFFLYSSVLRASAEEIEKTFDAPVGVGYFIKEIAQKSTTAKDFFLNLSSKTYTQARLKRVVMYFAFGLTELTKKVGFTNLLCADARGRNLIKNFKKHTNLKVITKNADTNKLNEEDKKIYSIGKKVDEIYFTLLEKPQTPNGTYKKSAIII